MFSIPLNFPPRIFRFTLTLSLLDGRGNAFPALHHQWCRAELSHYLHSIRSTYSNHNPVALPVFPSHLIPSCSCVLAVPRVPPPPSSQARLGSGRASGPMDDGLMAGCGVSARWGPVVCACIKVRMRKRNVLNLVAAGEDSIINRKGPTARSCRTWPWPPKSLQ